MGKIHKFVQLIFSTLTLIILNKQLVIIHIWHNIDAEINNCSINQFQVLKFKAEYLFNNLKKNQQIGKEAYLQFKYFLLENLKFILLDINKFKLKYLVKPTEKSLNQTPKNVLLSVTFFCIFSWINLIPKASSFGIANIVTKQPLSREKLCCGW